MNITVLDRSNYLKGLFITAKIDKELTQKEKDILKKISDKLGFATDFYQETIRSLLTNKYIKEEVIVFSNTEIAQSFLTDAIQLVCSNNRITDEEITWLKNTAVANNLNTEMVDKELNLYKESPSLLSKKDFALFSII